jgi:hydrogenase nickel incorporation protein HypA/HybF
MDSSVNSSLDFSAGTAIPLVSEGDYIYLATRSAMRPVMAINTASGVASVMHEVSVMSGIIEGVLEELSKHDVEKVEEVTLVIGESTFLGRDQMEFAFEILSKGTPLEGAQLIIEDEPVEVECPSCHYSGKAEMIQGPDFHVMVPKLNCPSCGKNANMTKGRSCRVASIKVVER